MPKGETAVGRRRREQVLKAVFQIIQREKTWLTKAALSGVHSEEKHEGTQLLKVKFDPYIIFLTLIGGLCQN